MGDEAAFDSLRGEPSSDYAPDPFLEGSLSALAFNRGESGSERGSHAPAAYAARQLRAALRSDGIHVSGSGGAVTALPSGAIQLATLPSPTIAQLVGLMLPALGQLLRRDAREGDRGPARRRGDDPGRGQGCVLHDRFAARDPPADL